jgi:hypothetical protein
MPYGELADGRLWTQTEWVVRGGRRPPSQSPSSVGDFALGNWLPQHPSACAR